MEIFFLFIKSVVLVTLIFIPAFSLTLFIFGFFPFNRTRALTDDEKNKVREYGICHKTSQKGKEGIVALSKIKGGKWWMAYSNHFRKSAFFFANAYIQDGEVFNDNPKYRYTIFIQRLTEEQLQNFKIRKHDKALIYNGDFMFDEVNQIRIDKIEKHKYRIVQILLLVLKSLLPSRFSIYLLLSCFLALVLLCPYIYFIFSLFG